MNPSTKQALPGFEKRSILAQLMDFSRTCSRPAAKAVVLALFLLLSPGKTKGQTLVDSAASFPVIMQYYSFAELQQMDSMKLCGIIYYFTQSFTVESISCNDCVPFDSLNFDVLKWEQYRQFSQVFTRDFDKYGFRLTLVPVSQMQYTMPIHDRFFENQPAENNPR